MTLKFGYVGIANGGAKAGIIGNPEGPLEERMALLRKFSHAIQPVKHTFFPHADMGTTRAEINEAFGRSDRRNEPSREQSGFFTASSVVVCASVAANLVGKKMNQLTAAIEGFGKVGSAVATFLQELGVRIVAVSTSSGAIFNNNGLNVSELIRFSEKYGSAFVEEFQEAEKTEKHQLLTMAVDLLCPCGAGGSIHKENAEKIKASIISSGANSPITPEAESLLQNAGILSVPDFISNCGGVLGGTMFYAGMHPMDIRKLIQEMLTARLTNLFQQSWKQGTSIYGAGEREALERFAKIKEQAEKPSFKSRIFQIGLSMYKHHLIPKFLMRRAAPDYFTTKMK
jgi:glutamate dehydrogenase/leucine dehydrogenase